MPLLRVVDEYGFRAQRPVEDGDCFLFADRLEGELRVKAAARSLQLQSRVGLSLDGLEGQGGLNKGVTIIAARDNR